LSSVLIQEQVQALYAGAAFTRSPRPYADYHALIELIKGPASDLLAGQALGALYGVDLAPPTDSLTQLAGPEHPLEELTPMLAAVLATARQVEELLGEPQDIEWVWTGGDDVYVVQARPARAFMPPLVRPQVLKRVAPRPPKLPQIDKIGQKAAAALYFKDERCGALNVQVIFPGWTDDTITKELSERAPSPDGRVIRFSEVDKATAGLPVEFIADQDLALSYLQARDRAHASAAGKASQGKYAGIVSDYVFVERSFEAYVDDKTLIIEHVPGNWEPRNSLRPDLMIVDGEDIQVWKAKDRRTASYELPAPSQQSSTLLRDADPVDDRHLCTWAFELRERFRGFRRDFAGSLPLNFHFVRSPHGWHFLNIRPTRDLPVERSRRSPGAQFKRRRLFLVTSADDLLSWDGAAPILVTGASDRNGGLAELAKALRDSAVRTVYTTFGVLSHPALVLREFGLEVQPMYDHYEQVWVPPLGSSDHSPRIAQPRTSRVNR
jgi:hypothetical protein